MAEIPKHILDDEIVITEDFLEEQGALQSAATNPNPEIKKTNSKERIEASQASFGAAFTHAPRFDRDDDTAEIIKFMEHAKRLPNTPVSGTPHLDQLRLHAGSQNPLKLGIPQKPTIGSSE